MKRWFSGIISHFTAFCLKLVSRKKGVALPCLQKDAGL